MGVWRWLILGAVALIGAIAIGFQVFMINRERKRYEVPWGSFLFRMTGTIVQIVSVKKLMKFTFFRQQDEHRLTYWVVREEGSNRKLIALFNRTSTFTGKPGLFHDLPANFKRGDRVKVEGIDKELKMENDAEMRLLAEIDTNSNIVHVMIADRVKKLEPMYLAASKETGPAAQVLLEVKGDPKGELMLVASRLEHTVKSRVNESFPESRELIDSMSVPQLYKLGVDRDLFPAGYGDSIGEFQRARNRVAHPETGTEMEDSEAERITALGAEILSEIS